MGCSGQHHSAISSINSRSPIKHHSLSMRHNVVSSEEESQHQQIVGGEATVLSLCSVVSITDDLLLVYRYHGASLYLNSYLCIVNI